MRKGSACVRRNRNSSVLLPQAAGSPTDPPCAAELSRLTRDVRPPYYVARCLLFGQAWPGVLGPGVVRIPRGSRVGVRAGRARTGTLPRSCESVSEWRHFHAVPLLCS